MEENVMKNQVMNHASDPMKINGKLVAINVLEIKQLKLLKPLLRRTQRFRCFIYIHHRQNNHHLRYSPPAAEEFCHCRGVMPTRLRKVVWKYMREEKPHFSAIAS